MSKDLTQGLNGSFEQKVDWLVTAISRMESRMGSMESRIESIDSRLLSLETKVDERLKDTRPMWEAVQAQLTELREEHKRLRYDTEKGFRLIDKRLERQPIEMERLHGFQRDLEERADDLEKRLGE